MESQEGSSDLPNIDSIGEGLGILRASLSASNYDEVQPAYEQLVKLPCFLAVQDLYRS